MLNPKGHEVSIDIGYQTYYNSQEEIDLIEKLFVSYRETFSDAKKVLDRYSIGLAHHKVIHLLSMYKGISISELLKRLKVTKQSLNRVLKDLIKLEIITFKKDFSLLKP